MRLTETQKKFRKEMRELNQQESPYDAKRNGNPFHRRTLSNVTLFIIVVLIAIAVQKYSTEGTGLKPGKGQAEFPSQSIAGASSNLLLSEKVVSGRNISIFDVKKLEQLHDLQNQIDVCWDTVSKFHKIPWNKRNVTEYNEALMEGITVSNALFEKAKELDFDSDFSPVFLNEKELLFESGLAFKYYLDHLHTKKKSDLDLGNKNLMSVNERKNARLSIFREVLDKNKYKYEGLDNGGIRYFTDSY